MDQDYIIDVDTPDIITQTIIPPHSSNDTNIRIDKPDFSQNSRTSQNDTNDTTNIDSNKQANNNDPWNYKILLLLRKIGKKTMGYRWMHEQESKYYNKIHNRITIIEMLMIAFLGTITGGGFVNFIVNSDFSGNKIL